MANEVGAKTATKAPARIMATFYTISKLARLVMAMNP